MKLTFLGTSHGVPEKNRRCTSLMLNVNGSVYIFDAGLMLIEELRSREVDLTKLRGVFITHLHGDHCNGLIEFTDLLTWYFTTVRPQIFVPEIKAHDCVRRWLELTINDENVLKNMPNYCLVEEGEFYKDENVTVTAVRNRHLKNRPSYSYIIRAEGKQIILTGDMSNDLYSDIPKEAVTQSNDLIVTEAAHCRLLDCPVLRQLNTKQLYVSHVVPHNEKEAIELNNLVNYPVVLAYDGKEIDI